MSAPLTGDRAPEPAVRRARPLAELDSADRVVVLRLDDRECTPHVLRGTAAAIWHEIDGRRTPDAICEALAEAYRTSLETVRADVLACLDVLRSAGLLDPEHAQRER